MTEPTARTRRGRPPVPAAARRPITTLLVDDHEVVRQGLRVLLEAENDIVVVGEAANGLEAIEMAARLGPDVVVMDIAMPMLNGIEATRQILDAAPAARVVVLSAHSDEEYVDQVTTFGATGYVLKRASLEQLAAAIRAARTGKRYLSPSIEGQRGSRRARAPLTTRQAEVLQMVAEGMASKQVALELGISIKTVEKHRQSLMEKLDIHDTAGLTRYAISIGSIGGRDRDACE